MAERDKSLPTTLAEGVQKLQDELVPRVAKLMRPVLGNVPVSKQERQRRWWQADPKWPTDPEQARIHELRLQGFNPDGTPIVGADGTPVKGLSREDVGLLKYSMREVDARAFGGADDRGAATYARDMSEQGPPAPEPLEVAAREAEARSRPAPAPAAPGLSETFAAMPLDLGG